MQQHQRLHILTTIFIATLALLLIAVSHVSGANELPDWYVTGLRSNAATLAQFGGTTNAVATQGNYLYAGAGPRLVVMDATNPFSPTVVGRGPILIDAINHIEVVGSYAYVTADTLGLLIYDVSDPANPTIIGHADTLGTAVSVVVSGTYAFVADGYAGLAIFDVAVPTNPQFVSSLEFVGIRYNYPSDEDPIGNGFINALDIEGTHLYLADRVFGARIIDVTAPSQPVELNLFVSSTAGFKVVDVLIQGQTLFISAGNTGFPIQILDVTDPTNIVVLKTSNIPGGYLQVKNGLLMVLSGGILRFVDFSSFSNPVEIGATSLPTESIGWPAATYGMAFINSTAYIANDSKGVTIVNVTDISAAQTTNSIAGVGRVGNVVLYDTLAYVQTENEALQVYDVSNTELLTSVQLPFTTGVSVDLLRRIDNQVFVQASQSTYALEAANPLSFTQLSAYDGRIGTIAGNVLYTTSADGIAGEDGGLYAYDYSDPANLSLLSKTSSSYLALDVIVKGNYAYVSHLFDDIVIFDVSDPTNMVEVNRYQEEAVGAYAINGDYLYAVIGYNDHEQLHAINISNPLSLTATIVDIPSFQRNTSVNLNLIDEHLFLSLGTGGVEILTLNDPANPEKIGFYESTDALAMDSFGNVLGIADGDGGLLLLDFDKSKVKTAPAAPAAISPTGNDTTTSQPQFSWSPTVSDTVYEFELSAENLQESNGTTILSQGRSIRAFSEATSFAPPINLLEGEYSWRIRVRDGSGNWSDWSEDQLFNVSNLPTAVVGNGYGVSAKNHYMPRIILVIFTLTVTAASLSSYHQRSKAA